jgi:hypothetical protein
MNSISSIVSFLGVNIEETQKTMANPRFSADLVSGYNGSIVENTELIELLPTLSPTGFITNSELINALSNRESHYLILINGGAVDRFNLAGRVKALHDITKLIRMDYFENY